MGVLTLLGREDPKHPPAKLSLVGPVATMKARGIFGAPTSPRLTPAPFKGGDKDEAGDCKSEVERTQEKCKEMPILIPYRKALKPFAKDLRNNMTDAEIFLWRRIRRRQIHGIQFLRQKPIATFILDFYAKQIKLAIEVDGGQHFTIEHQSKDMNRDAYLYTLGIYTLRFTNLEVLNNCSGVLSTIEATVLERLSKCSHCPL